ncbi:hypothetical protein TrCOL_g660 [Triparma columacea]|uniref:Uncharacterized protein n=1 Tax=Triparma columacea TaxID=722753 RepID=A0A9W7GKK4_9STRA|nr:hypothetical protein TrCOL_g660 [Triparma columacea]
MERTGLGEEDDEEEEEKVGRGAIIEIKGGGFGVQAFNPQLKEEEVKRADFRIKGSGVNEGVKRKVEGWLTMYVSEKDRAEREAREVKERKEREERVEEERRVREREIERKKGEEDRKKREGEEKERREGERKVEEEKKRREEEEERNRNKLEDIRNKIKAFDKDKTVKARRMQMKKLAAGGLNTLVKEPTCILDVISRVKQAIKSSLSSDLEAPQGSPGKVGTLYLLDLLASSLGKRVGAESYSVKNIDGYPLAVVVRAIRNEGGEEGKMEEVIEAHGEHNFTFWNGEHPGTGGRELQEEMGIREGETWDRWCTRMEAWAQFRASELGVGEGGDVRVKEWMRKWTKGVGEKVPLYAGYVIAGFMSVAGRMIRNDKEVLGEVERIVKGMDGEQGGAVKSRVEGMRDKGWEVVGVVEEFYGNKGTRSEEEGSNSKGTRSEEDNNSKGTHSEEGSNSKHRLGGGGNNSKGTHSEEDSNNSKGTHSEEDNNNKGTHSEEDNNNKGTHSEEGNNNKHRKMQEWEQLPV